MGDLAGKAAIVTGGSRGIGRAIALKLASEGTDVAVCSRTSGAAEGVAAEIEKLGVRALAQRTDVSVPLFRRDSMTRSAWARATRIRLRRGK